MVRLGAAICLAVALRLLAEEEEACEASEASMVLLQHRWSVDEVGEDEVGEDHAHARLAARQQPAIPFYCPSCCDDVSLNGDSRFAVREFSQLTWYVQQQQETSYMKADKFRCVLHTFVDEGAAFGRNPPWFWGQFMSDYVYWKDGRATELSPDVPNKATRSCWSITNAQDKAKMRGAPCWVPPKQYGTDLWVIDASIGPDGTWLWMIVSGGLPLWKVMGQGCTTGTGTFNSGLWIMSTVPELPEEEVNKARTSLLSRGYTTSQLKDVPQGAANGCDYQGAFIKGARPATTPPPATTTTTTTTTTLAPPAEAPSTSSTTTTTVFGPWR